VNHSHLILGVGELLWDLLPDGEQLGGAPANFAAIAAQMGNHAVILSRIGRDAWGRRAMERLNPMPVDAGFLQVDAGRETGRVTVEFHNGQPKYTIHSGSAWDALELSDDWVQLAERADAICFGSLGQRSAESRQTIQTLVAQTAARCVRIFDVNLRAPFYSGEVIQESLEQATVVKMNQDELPQVLSLLGFPEDEGAYRLRQGAGRILAEFSSLQMVAITCGAAGSLLVTRRDWDQHPGFQVKVADTIGAGDAFTAALAHSLIRGADLATLNEAGNRCGSWVASEAGAMPTMPESLRNQWADRVER
jgi:fructokinase